MSSSAPQDNFPRLAGSYKDVSAASWTALVAVGRKVRGEGKVAVVLKVESVAAEEFVDVGIWLGYRVGGYLYGGVRGAWAAATVFLW